MNITELKEKLTKEIVRTEYVILSDRAKILVDKLFQCEPPCDSYGVCTNCNEQGIFQSGYNLGHDAHRIESAKTITALLEIIEIQREALKEIITHVNPHRDGLDGRFEETKSTIVACNALAETDKLLNDLDKG